MTEKFILSEKRKEDCQDGFYHEKDVKEFIKKLKDKISVDLLSGNDRLDYYNFAIIIDKLAGDKLI
jgi:hypothetical protein